MLWLCVRRAGQAERCGDVYSSWGTVLGEVKKRGEKYWIGKILVRGEERHLLLGERGGDIKEREPKVGKRKRESQGKSKRTRVSRPEVSYGTRESGTADAREGERD
jgi:hypothetical protein